MNVCAFCHSVVRDYESIVVDVEQVWSPDQCAAGSEQNSG